jgi:hypothetical protein
MTLNQPVAVYISNCNRPPKNEVPSSPNGLRAAWSAGPTTNPKTCANDTIDTAPVRSSIFVAADRYDRQTAILARKEKRFIHLCQVKQDRSSPELTPTRNRDASIQYLWCDGNNSITEYKALAMVNKDSEHIKGNRIEPILLPHQPANGLTTIWAKGLAATM